MNFLTKHLFNGVWEKDIFRVEGTKVYYKGRVMSDEHRQIIRDDAEKFANSVLWKLLSDECAYQANLKQFQSGTKEIDVVAGRMMLYNLDIIDKVIKNKLLNL